MEMKNAMKTIVAAIAVCGLMASCSTKEDVNARDGVIRLGAGAATRASINSVADLAQYSGDKVGIFGVEAADATNGAIDWTKTVKMSNVQTSSIDASGAMHWVGIYYYPSETAEGNKFVQFCAYHPYAAAGTTGDNYIEELSGAAPKLHFTLTGEEDVMYAAPVVGSYSTDPANLVFKHVLTQLTFALSDAKDSFKGATLNKITIKDANTKSTMDVEKGTLGEWSEKGALVMPNISNIAINAKDGQNINSAIMLQPGQATFKIDVETSMGTFTDVTIKPTGEATAFEAAKSYRVTLKFSDKKLIALSAEVQPWVEGGTGEGTLE